MAPGELVASRGAFKLEDGLFVAVQALPADQ